MLSIQGKWGNYFGIQLQMSYYCYAVPEIGLLPPSKLNSLQDLTVLFFMLLHKGFFIIMFLLPINQSHPVHRFKLCWLELKNSRKLREKDCFCRRDTVSHCKQDDKLNVVVAHWYSALDYYGNGSGFASGICHCGNKTPRTRRFTVYTVNCRIWGVARESYIPLRQIN